MNSNSILYIQQAIPHRPPMLLIDTVLALEENSIHCQKRFREDEFFVQGHYPQFPIVPGVILCECAAQAGAILLSGKFAQQLGIPVLTRMSDVKFKSMVRPGDTVDIVVKLDEVLSNAYFLSAQVKIGSSLAARLSFACARVDLS
jgi:3-hydroxyacyl-[acyl-carrier-protein] dehydratase